MKKHNPANSGFTIVELMIAVFILSIVSYSLLKGLYTGDRIRGRANVARAACTLAENEAERIRGDALRGVEPQESTSEETVSGIAFTVSRRKINTAVTGTDTKNENITEMEISVEPQSEFFPSYKFKLIQGFHQ